MKKVCSRCQKEKFYIEDSSGIFRDDSGSPWSSLVCPDCRKARDIKRTRSKGIHRSIDDQSYHNFVLSRWSEKRAAKVFDLLGFKDIKLTTASGPDLTMFESGIKRTCEVKAVLKDPNGHSFFTTSVTKKRKSDDFVAIVFPDGEVWIESMSLHLQKATACGRRTLTTEMREIYGSEYGRKVSEFSSSSTGSSVNRC